MSELPHYRRKLCELFACTPEELGLLPDEAHFHPANGYVEGGMGMDAGVESAQAYGRPDVLGNGKSGGRVAAPLASAPRPGTVATTFPLPHAVRLIGRDEFMAQLKRVLLSSHNLAVNGLPGIGKTATALALLNDDEVSASFPDGILWAPLGRTSNLLAGGIWP